MTTTIDDLLKKDSDDSSVNITNDHGLHITQDETAAALESKMDEMDRRNLETETLQKARGMNLGYVSLHGVSIVPSVIKMIPEEVAREKKVVCFYYAPYKEIRVATPHPEDTSIHGLIQNISNEYNTAAKLFLVSEPSIEEALKQYSRLPHISHVEQKVSISPEELDRFAAMNQVEDLQAELGRVSVSEMVVAIIAGALHFNASDIHIEAEEHQVVLRYRLDGIMEEVAILPKEQFKQLSSRIKLLADVMINVTDRPQDGHFAIEQKNGRVDVRVSTLPTNFGESIVMRVLRNDITQLDLSDIGLGKHYYDLLSHEIKRPNGMLVVCGPTGSGKTTTLYSILRSMNKQDTKIVTIEDPIEYVVDGISQSQVHAEEGYTFAAGLRSLVRQDPDVILVGEMRDQETVEIAINAALTGHLVLSTIHTNDAAGAIPRFLAMGAKPYLLAPATNTIIAQRLTRKLCESCKKPAQLDADSQKRVDELISNMPESIRQSLQNPLTFYTHTGCNQCHGMGYKGRIGIFEIFTMTPELQKIVLSSTPSEVAMQEYLHEKGMITMAQDGVLKALQGITTIEEVFRVTDS